MTSSKLAYLLPPDELRLLEKLSVSLKPTFLTFERKLTQGQMRTVWTLLMNMRVRAIAANDDSINCALGNWLLTAGRWFGEKFVQNSTEEEHKLRAFRDH